MTTQTLTLVHKAHHANMEAATPAKLPLGEIVAQQCTAQHQENPYVSASIGVWESSPGVFRRHLPNREFCHIISGSCTFTPDGGEPVELSAGDAVLFPAD